MEYIEIFDQISFGTVIACILALLFLGGLMFKGLEKYHNLKKNVEDKDKEIQNHDTEINKLKDNVSEINTKIDDVLICLDKVITSADQRESRRLRREILKFSDGIRNGKIYSRDAFQDIMESNQEYENLILTHGITNGFTEHEMAFIEKKYDELYGG